MQIIALRHSYDESAIEEAKRTKSWRIIYSLLLKLSNEEHERSELVVPLDSNGNGQHVQYDKPRAIDLRIGDAIKFMPKNGKPEFFTIQKIEAFRDADCDDQPKRNEGFVMAVNR